MPSLVGSPNHISFRARHPWFSFYQKIELAFEHDPQLHHVLVEVSEVRRMMCAAVWPSHTKLLVPALASTTSFRKSR